MNKTIIANFKMNKSLEECNEYIDNFFNYGIADDKRVVICPPDFAVDNYAKAFETKLNVYVGAQDCSTENNGSFTGELSASMIKSTGAKYVIVGHSERRIKLNETDKTVNQKAIRAVNAGLIPIICIGERLEEISKKKTVLSRQLTAGLKKLDVSRIIVAYEPIWAIGTGRTCEVKDIKETHTYIKDKVMKIAGIVPEVVYGGSVKPTNAHDILSLDEVDGVLVGGASLDPRSFYAIITSV